MVWHLAVPSCRSCLFFVLVLFTQTRRKQSTACCSALNARMAESLFFLFIFPGEEEVELHVNLAELLGFLFKTHGEAFLPAFEELLLPSVMEMARPDSLPEDRKVRQ